MQRYEILQDFKGSHTGSDVVEFKAGEVVELSDDLAATVVPEKWAKKTKKPLTGQAEDQEEVAPGKAEASADADPGDTQNPPASGEDAPQGAAAPGEAEAAA